MSGSIPKPIAAYFEGNARLDVDAMLAPFAEDAVVSDEKRTHRGRQAIRAWIEQATIGNQAVVTPQSVAPDDADQLVVAKVAGAFPGSPITLTFRFTLADGRIVRLAIG
jgi:hypothetical protein